jgi:hypothetical protein
LSEPDHVCLYGAECFLSVIVASRGFGVVQDLNVAMSNFERGFGAAQAIVAGIVAGDKVQLQFPRLIDQSGFFGRDQGEYLLDSLFSKVKPRAFKLSRSLVAHVGPLR